MIWNSSYTPYEPPMPRFSHPSDLQTSSESWSPRRLLSLRSETKPEQRPWSTESWCRGPKHKIAGNTMKQHLLISSHDSPWIVVAIFWGCRIEPFCISFTEATLAQGSLWQHRDYRYFAFRGDPFGDSTAVGSSWFTSAAAGTPPVVEDSYQPWKMVHL